MAHQVYSGLTATTADEVFPILYTKKPGEAVEIAKKIVEEAGWGSPSPEHPAWSNRFELAAKRRRGVASVEGRHRGRVAS